MSAPDLRDPEVRGRLLAEARAATPGEYFLPASTITTAIAALELIGELEGASAKTTRFVRFMDWLIGDLTRAMHGALIAGRENPAEALAFIEGCLDHHDNLPNWSGTFSEWLEAKPGKPAPPLLADDALAEEGER